jgi:O-antigen/teichoic acid export membrane protein
VTNTARSGAAFNSAAAWSTGSAAAGQLIRFGLFVALSRLVSPTEFGLVALAAILIELLGSVSDGGVSEAAVRHPTLDQDQASTAFWLILAFGIMGGVCAVALAPLAAHMFKTPSVAPVIVLMASTLVISPLGSVHIARVTRALGFRKLAMWNLASNVVAGLFGIWLAFQGFGVWAIAARSVVSTTGMVLLAWIGSPWRPSFAIDRRAARDFLGLGSQLLGARVIGQVNARGVELIAGLVIAPAAVGFLRVGAQCLNLLTQLTIAPLTQISMPLLARSIGDPALYEDAVSRVARLSAVVIYPVFFGAMAISSLAFPIVFGAHWSLSGIVMPILCALAIPLQANLLINAVLVAQGQGKLILKWTILQACIGLPLALLGGTFGLFALVALTVLRSYIMLPIGLTWLRRHAGTPALGLIRPSLRPFAAALAMAVVVIGLKLALIDHMDARILLGLLVLVGMAVFAILALMLDPILRASLTRTVKRSGVASPRA